MLSHGRTPLQPTIPISHSSMSSFTLTETCVRSLLEPGVQTPGTISATAFLPGSPFFRALEPNLRWVITDADGECITGVKTEGVFVSGQLEMPCTTGSAVQC